MSRLMSALTLLTLFGSNSFAATLLVPSQYSTIQTGINAAVHGDTVLVAEGTYTGSGNKNIDFLGKAIVVKSENGPETCIIDCQNEGRGFNFHTNEDSNSVLSGIKVMNGVAGGPGYFDDYGGGIYITNSAPIIFDCIISDNRAAEGGGGISCSGGVIENCTISSNIVEAEYGGGGGIGCSGSTLVSNCLIINNQCLEWSSVGGGIYCSENAVIVNSTINWNYSDVGGGLFCDGSTTISNCDIMGNSGWGGGITCAMNSNVAIGNCAIRGNNNNGINLGSNSTVHLAGNNISYNLGNGIYSSTSSVFFDPLNRCSIYFNRHYENVGNDLCWNVTSPIRVFVDTFTVINPTQTQAYPLGNFVFNIFHGIYNPVNADLYISPNGNNYNSGLTPEEPLKTISYALNIIQSDSLHPHTIYLSPGIYSSETNGEIFPLLWSDYTSLQGSGQNVSILDGNHHSSLLRLWYGGNHSNIRHIAIINGYIPYGGEGAGISCFAANPTIEYCTISDNEVGVYGNGGGISCHYNSNITMRYCIISGNTAGDWGGGLWCHNASNPLIENCTFYGNSAYWGGGIFYSTNPTVRNCILWNNLPDQIQNVIGSAEVTYSDIMGGYSGQGNINVNPLFENPAQGNFHITWANYPIPDSSRSPCIDAGDPNSHLDPDSTIADMGALYFHQGTEVTIFLTPINPPLVIPPGGGSFSFHAIMDNNTNTPQNFDLWSTIQTPFGYQFTAFGPLNVNLEPGGNITRLRTQAVPANSPAGQYLYRGFVGDHPWTVADADSFPFSKAGNITAWLGPEGWVQTGDPFLYEVATDQLPLAFKLQPAHPNPFNPTTTLSFKLQAASQVSLKVYDTAGRLVATLADGWGEAGTHTVTFNGSGLASGIYLAKMEVSSSGSGATPTMIVQKLVLMK